MVKVPKKNKIRGKSKRHVHNQKENINRKIPKKNYLGSLNKKPLTYMKPRVGAPITLAKSKPQEQSQDRSQNTLHENRKLKLSRDSIKV